MNWIVFLLRAFGSHFKDTGTGYFVGWLLRGFLIGQCSLCLVWIPNLKPRTTQPTKRKEPCSLIVFSLIFLFFFQNTLYVSTETGLLASLVRLWKKIVAGCLNFTRFQKEILWLIEWKIWGPTLWFPALILYTVSYKEIGDIEWECNLR